MYLLIITLYVYYGGGNKQTRAHKTNNRKETGVAGSNWQEKLLHLILGVWCRLIHNFYP